MAQAVIRRPFRVEARVRSQASPYEICGGRVAVEQGFLRVVLLYPISVVPPMLRALHVHVSFTSRTSGRSMGTFQATVLCRNSGIVR